MTAIDSELVAVVENDLPCVSRPFQALAKRADDRQITEQVLLDTIGRWIEAGVIRRYGAVVAHHALGYQANAMIVWRAPNERVGEIGEMLAGQAEVSHCYQRPPFEGFPYNLYTMVHGRSREECERIGRRLSGVVGIEDYRILFSVREFKKTSPTFG